MNPLPTRPAPADTKEHLLRVALGEFAQRGVDGVSLAQIQQKSGHSNRSVVHYHFQNKDNLVDAVFQWVVQELSTHCQPSLQALKEGGADTTQVDGLCALMFDPLIMMMASGRDGARAVRFLSRLTWQSGERGQRFLTDFFMPYLAPFVPALSRLLSHLSEAQLRFRLYLAVNTAIHGLADFSILTPDDTLKGLGHHGDPLLEMRRLFLGYIAGGLSA